MNTLLKFINNLFIYRRVSLLGPPEVNNSTYYGDQKVYYTNKKHI